MSNTLFIVCPFSSLESFLRKRFGNDIFFLTYSGAVVQSNDYDYTESIVKFILRENIKNIYIVNDVSCLFIHNIVHRENLFGLSSESAIQNIYTKNYETDFHLFSPQNQKVKLAELNIAHQISNIVNNSLLGLDIAKHNIEIKGLLTDKANDYTREIAAEGSKNLIHEF